ncbi:MAG: hypothetical protein ACREJ3_00940 [Polyangiaceae bacterium]
MLQDKLAELFRLVSGGEGQAPSPASVLIAELKPGNFVAGRPRIKSEELHTPEAYEARFQQLMSEGFGWINLNYCGLARGAGLVLVNYPRQPAQRKGATSVNFSGPPRRVAVAGWDALAHVTIT